MSGTNKEMASKPTQFRTSSATRVAALAGVAVIVAVIAWLLMRGGGNASSGSGTGGAGAKKTQDCSKEWTSANVSNSCDGKRVEFRVKVASDGDGASYKNVYIPGNPPDTDLALSPKGDATPLLLQMCDLDTFTLFTNSKGGAQYAVVLDDRHDNTLSPGGNSTHASYCANADKGEGVWRMADGQLWSDNSSLMGFSVRSDGSKLSATSDGAGDALKVQWRQPAPSAQTTSSAAQ